MAGIRALRSICSCSTVLPLHPPCSSKPNAAGGSARTSMDANHGTGKSPVVITPLAVVMVMVHNLFTVLHVAERR